MIGRTNTGGGGGGLNFQVVGGTVAPSNPRENTIWIKTENKITSWIFSATEPETPAEGMVWISMGASSPAAFNALKKNGITVYPINARQYIDGVWVSAGAKSYQDGKWVEWFNGYFYKEGTFFYSHSEKKTPDNATLTYGETYVQMKTVADKVSEVYVVIGPVNLDAFSEINAKFTMGKISGSSNVIASLFVSKTEGDSYANAVAKDDWSRTGEITSSVSGSASIDVSNLSGDYYIHAGTHTKGGTWSLVRTVSVNEIGGVLA